LKFEVLHQQKNIFVKKSNKILTSFYENDNIL
jgi:hypothetical protein